MSKQYFGTDGIRGRVGQTPITPDFMLKLGWACGSIFAQQSAGQPTVVIGKDTRVSGYLFESALEAGLVAAGANVRLLGPLPTPGIALLTRSLKATAGIVISASHNPHWDNGIKFFDQHGQKLSDDIELAIEALIAQPLVMAAPENLGKASRISDAAGRYVEFCKATFDDDLNLTTLKIVVDCAHGATYQVAPAVFSELGAEVVSIGVDPDGFNINSGVGSTAPTALRTAVLQHRADVGIAFDGDGDRVIMVNSDGDIVDGDELLFIIAMHRLSNGNSDAGVVGTLMSNMGLELALAEEGLQFVRAQVGDRYVKEQMVAHGWELGGESSGHIICGGLTTTGDGVVAALQVLSAMVRSDRSLRALSSRMIKLPQVLLNVPCDDVSILDSPAVLAAKQRVDDTLAGRGRLLLRPSGTEPVVRVMVEGNSETEVTQLAEGIANIIGAAQ